MHSQKTKLHTQDVRSGIVNGAADGGGLVQSPLHQLDCAPYRDLRRAVHVPVQVLQMWVSICMCVGA